VAALLEARYFQANAKVMMITGPPPAASAGGDQDQVLLLNADLALRVEQGQLHPLSKSMPKKGNMPNSLG
jgi:hypothetical protein